MANYNKIKYWEIISILVMINGNEIFMHFIGICHIFNPFKFNSNKLVFHI